jgi:hypothetical protein
MVMTKSPRVSLTSTFIAPGDLESTRRAVLLHLAACSLRVRSDEPAEIVATGGSQFVTRLIGMWISPRDAYPRRARIAFSPSVDGTRVDAVFEETLGFGFLDSYSRSNYLAAFQSWLDGLGRALGQPLVAVCPRAF